MTALPTNLTAGTWNIDPVHSSFGFSVRHSGVSKVRGEFEDIAGTIEIGEQFEDTTITASAKIDSVNTKNEQRDGHLKSGDFFLAEEYPEMTFAATQIKDFDGEDFVLVGDLTIRGVAKSVEFAASFNGVSTGGETPVAGFEASATINRKDFGLSFDVVLPGGDLLVGDKVKISIDIEAAKA
ncbi:YceI family protein [Brevibacterium sp. 50QC2O2]|jgi:polyisoprenoid-binding protein YceI|uniref:YceI family protein n=1 Tax=Brevibacterium TaxID=1696 RepID=UPI00211C16F3|nr:MULTISPECIES: YceI family protein [unclassified Brevibacterium]MCQ9368445.1 YceI family protein [Brevibacterium sp. 91QC2O2]MCQ9384773.1 YceI family protein [Brevibacterium sp. 68QC2CO]MCQ9387535.1 YceI family protein [Brevibacterium sp. 50QC2O2]